MHKQPIHNFSPDCDANLLAKGHEGRASASLKGHIPN